MAGENEEFEFRLRAEKERTANYASFPRPLDALDNPNMATEGQSFGTNFLSGAGKALTDFGRGVGQIINKVPQSEIDDAAKRDAPLMKTGGGFSGNVAGNVAAMLPTMLIPGANSIGGGAAIGSVMGALQPTETGQSRGQNAFLGGLGGGLGNAASKVASSVINPNTSAEVKALMQQGVTPTPGQIMGGRLQSLEDRLTSVPVLGDAISSARTKGLDEFQRAAYARALAPIGATPSGEIGREGVKSVRETLNNAYEKLLPNVSFKADPQISSDITNLQGMISNVGKPQAERFNSIINWMQTKITPQGNMNGATMKEVESELSRLARGYKGDPSFSERQLGSAIEELRTALRENLARNNPAHAEELQKINTGWANYTRLRDAASRVGSEEGKFSPSALASAVRGGDKTVGKRAFSEGDALLQDLSDAGKKVLSNKYPDSGTAGRALLGMAVNPAQWPALATGAAASTVASLPYLPGGRQITAAMLARRPEIAAQLAEALRNTGPQIGMAGSAAMLGQNK
ncbi:hypothetical protein UFOVP1095_36 [uncultured Caudovirales phage]|uniref:Uncharacterized protein n=1 Tax=uncultured Caudovirales phage TaxID=2100421 RepID=A0A6J5PJZ4_9CAUD|nr:hypothetical protein UFOVP918_36 [uncultured Caudovirales phage]CAB4182723.1 hypothetical protein UFOVP1095_36 [uncultured Caudovirales phage]CAB4214262.1 hypothetical protein UFOVP1452_36 [uncultured Caudovirales phage]CAB5228317.1 hypothetical protein UFOVP1540_13 [uncultured Caudovirales phage]